MSPVSHGLQVPGARLEQVGKSEAGYMLLHFLRGRALRGAVLGAMAAARWILSVESTLCGWVSTRCDLHEDFPTSKCTVFWLVSLAIHDVA